MTTPTDQIKESLGDILSEVRQERGFIILGFVSGKRYQIYACGKVEFDYSADCWLGVERCDKDSLLRICDCGRTNEGQNKCPVCEEQN